MSAALRYPEHTQPSGVPCPWSLRPAADDLCPAGCVDAEPERAEVVTIALPPPCGCGQRVGHRATPRCAPAQADPVIPVADLPARWERDAAELDHDDPNGTEEAEDVGSAAAYRSCARQLRDALEATR